MEEVQEIELEFVDKVLRKLSPIDDITKIEEKDNSIALYKEEFKLGEIKSESVYLLDASGVLKEVADEVLNNSDNFLKAATKSYWIASGKNLIQ